MCPIIASNYLYLPGPSGVSQPLNEAKQQQTCWTPSGSPAILHMMSVLVSE